MKTPALLLLTLSLLLAPCALLHAAADKAALVIGNSAYPDEAGGDYGDLPNATRDALLMKTTLEKVGFTVVYAQDATKSVMDEKLTEFENSIAKGGTAVVYLAAHGIEFEKRNYILCSNAKGKARSRLGEESMEAETFAVAMVSAGAAQSFLFLDCCREKPDAEWVSRGRKGGGLEDMKITGDLIISFAARPGENAQDQPFVSGPGVLSQNGPYAQALAKWIPAGVKHSDLFDNVRLEVDTLTQGQQRTWESGSILQPYFFAPAQGGAVQVAKMVVPPAVPVIPPVVPAARAPAAGDELSVTLPGGVKMKFRFCPAGSFTMGSPASEADRSEDEKQVSVTLSRGFYVAETECTQGQWKAVMGGNPSNFQGDDLPVEMVSWETVHSLVTRLNGGTSTGLPTGWKWSLPTEAQWEYACRAGTTTATAFGDTLTATQANFNGNYPYGTTQKGTYLEKTSSVGSYEPNRWGLKDMHGNVYEWCLDSWDGTTTLPGGTDPVGRTGSYRVYRGGSWSYYGQDCRSAYRDRLAPGGERYYLGFRLAAVPVE
jgi:formylglycine-generating enzyme required for sulfatase activity